MEGSARIRSHKGRRRAPKGRVRKSLHTTLRCGQTKEGARKKKDTTGQRRGDTGNERPAGSPKNDKRSRAQPQLQSIWSVRTAQLKSSEGSSWVTQKHKTRESVGETSLLRLRPAKLRWSYCYLMPGPVGGPQPSVRRVDVDGPVAHEKPLSL